MAGTGHLGRLDLRPPEDLEVGRARLTVYPDAVAQVNLRGFTTPNLPMSGFKGQMPQDLTSLGDDELGDLLNNISQYCGYAEYSLAEASISREESQAELDYTMARVRIGVKANNADLGGGKLTVQDKNDLVETEPRVVAARSKALYTEAIYQLTKVIRDKAQRDWETVSRRITQRGQEIERMRRESNVAAVPAASTRTFRRPGQ